MTTAQSPLPVLRAQADKIAKSLKAMERGETVADDPAGKLAAAQARGRIKFGVVMDDKVITVEMPWATIRETDEAGLAEYILNHMREARNSLQ